MLLCLYHIEIFLFGFVLDSLCDASSQFNTSFICPILQGLFWKSFSYVLFCFGFLIILLGHSAISLSSFPLLLPTH